MFVFEVPVVLLNIVLLVAWIMPGARKATTAREPRLWDIFAFTAAIFLFMGSSMGGLPALLIVALVFTGTGIGLSRARNRSRKG